MQSGKFQHLISIERVVRPQNSVGDILEQWEPLPGFTRIMGQVLPERAGEFFAARQVQGTANALIRLYYQPGIDGTMRVRHHVRPGIDEYWDIQGVIPFQSNQRELRLMCLWREAEGYRRGVDLENAEVPGDAGDASADSDEFSSDSTLITADAA